MHATSLALRRSRADLWAGRVAGARSARHHGRVPPAFRFRESPEDFIVEELAAGQPPADPAGTHLWFTVEKRGVSTPEAARRIAQALGRDGGAVSFAGRKDAKAITRQTMCVEHVTSDALLAVDLERIRIEDPVRCRTKLRVGQHGGNRFHLRLTGLEGPEARDRLAEQLEALAEDGVPNAYGQQRFGPAGDSWRVGQALVKGTPLEYLESVVADGPPGTREAGEELLRRIRQGSGSERRRALELAAGLAPDLRSVARVLARRRPEDPQELVRAVPQRARAFHLAMLQARIFNRVLDARRAARSESTVLVGDVVLAADGRHRVVLEGDPPEAREGRVPTGPLWAATGLHAAGEPGRIELAALREEGLEPEDLRAPGGLRPRGARRPLVVPLSDLEVEAFVDGAVWIRFSLPVGSFATVVLAAIG